MAGAGAGAEVGAEAGVEIMDKSRAEKEPELSCISWSARIKHFFAYLDPVPNYLG